MRWILALFFLFNIPHFRGGCFSIRSILGPLLVMDAENCKIVQVLSQPYYYLGKGRQAFAFCSADGQWVLKFFNQKYFSIPFWAPLIPGERVKREKRRKFYLESYQLAQRALAEETGIVYLHLGPAPEPLPSLLVADQRGKTHQIDLNQIPFVLQRKSDPFYSALQILLPEELDLVIDDFLSLIALRIEKKISDADHDVENNFGILFGSVYPRVIQIDPGRFSVEERLSEPERLQYEWWSATHRFRKWLEKHHPEKVVAFDKRVSTR